MRYLYPTRTAHSLYPVHHRAKKYIEFDVELLKSSIADPDLGSCAFLTLDPGWVKNQDPDPGRKTRIIFPRA
jgi:hypothetical protein